MAFTKEQTADLVKKMYNRKDVLEDNKTLIPTKKNKTINRGGRPPKKVLNPIGRPRKKVIELYAKDIEENKGLTNLEKLLWKINTFKHDNNSAKGCVYFLQHPGGNIKIGFTANIAERLQKLNSIGGGFKLELLVKIDGNADLEHKIQTFMKDFRHGLEWFFPCSYLLDFVELLKNYQYIKDYSEANSQILARLNKRYEKDT